MYSTARKAAGLAGLALLVATASLTPATARVTGVADRSDKPRVVHVAGRQLPVDVENGDYKMRGDLIGSWKYIALHRLHQADTFYSEAGVEVFRGCIDLRGNGKCDGRDPRGELHFAFLYWASYDAEGGLIKGQCVHPVTGGRKDFAGARGRLDMVDRPAEDKIRTTYRGRIELRAVPGEGNNPTPPASAEPVETPVTLTTSITATAMRQKGC
jgi:hypothetical protein